MTSGWITIIVSKLLSLNITTSIGTTKMRKRKIQAEVISEGSVLSEEQTIDAL